MHRAGEVQVAVGTLSLTRSVTRPDQALPDEVHTSQTAAVYLSDTLRFPRFDMQPVNLAGKVLESVARSLLRIGELGKVDFASHPGFAGHYAVRAFDTERTRWLFEDRLLTQLAGRPGLNVSAANGTLLLFREGVEIPRENWQAFADQAFAVFRQFEAAASRPGAFNDPMRPRPSDYELFAKQLSATGLGFKELPGVTLAEAEAFIGQPTPRMLTPGISRYCTERAPRLVLHFGLVFAAVAALFLAAGWDSIPWYGRAALGLLLAAGTAMTLAVPVIRLRARHLLRHGRGGMARIEAIRTFDSRIDGNTKSRVDLAFEANGALHRASCLAPEAAIDRLKAIADGKRAVPVLYSAGNPARVLVADSLVLDRDVG